MWIITLKANLILLITAISGWYLLPTNGLINIQTVVVNRNEQQQLRPLLYNDVSKAKSKNFMLYNSTLGNSFNADKNFTTPAHLMFSYTTAPVEAFNWQLRKHYNFSYYINKSNQVNTSYNNENQTPVASSPVNLPRFSIPTTVETELEQAKASTSKMSSTTESTQSESVLDATKLQSSKSSSFLPASSLSFFERVELHEPLMHRENKKRLLHRNKRYLLFPEGSSFQLGKETKQKNQHNTTLQLTYLQ